ncbi:hypothetical protein EDB87DRAFT_1614804, partial [Lactarius vividus]
MSAAQIGGTRKAAALPLANAAFTENHAVRAMAGQEAEKTNAETMRRLEADAAKERTDAEAKALEVQEKAVRARERAYAKKAIVEAMKAEAKVKHEAEFGAKVEAAINVNEEAKVKAVEEMKAAAAKTELGAKKTVEKERLEIEAKSEAEAAKAQMEERRGAEVAKLVAKAELRAKQAAEQIQRQRVADRAARAASHPSDPMAPLRANGASWFGKITQAASVAASAIPTEGSTPPPTSISLWNSDPWSKCHVKNPPPPSTELALRCPGGSGIPIQLPSTTSSTPRGSAPTHPTTPITAASSSTSVVSSSPTANLVWQERRPINDKPDGRWFVLTMSYFGRQFS